jgi:hypothetical protein
MLSKCAAVLRSFHPPLAPSSSPPLPLSHFFPQLFSHLSTHLSPHASPLPQAYISRPRLESFSLTADMMYISSNCPRIVRALLEICLK